MAYTYYTTYKNNLAKAPKTDYMEEFQAVTDDQFYNSSDWYTIQEETSFGSGVYQNLDVRINGVINPTTGVNQGDDWKKLIFKNIDRTIRVGAMFVFDGNYWVTVSTSALSDFPTTCTVRRANNTLRWIDLDDGAKYDFPCVLDYIIQENRDYATAGSKFVNPSGLLQVITQLNATTNKIKPSIRFLFGNQDNWTAYEVFGGGVNNFNNPTATIGSTGILKLSMGVSHVNTDIDDLVNGYALAGKLVYLVELDKSAISGEVSDTFDLSATVTLNGDTVTRSVDWESDDEDVATVSSSGLVTFIATGSATITASLAGDSSIYDTCSVTVNTTPISEYVVVFTPETNYILEGNTQQYAVTLEKNGVTQADVFTFAIVAGTVPTDHYTFTSIDGNNFSVENIEKYVGEDLVVRATSGIYTKDISIFLKGAW